MTIEPWALAPRDCPACGSERASTRHTSGPWRVVACDDCGFVYLPEAATAEYLTQGQGAWESSLRENNARKMKESPLFTKLSMATRFRTKFRKCGPADFIEARFPRDRTNRINVLDIGCGGGDYLASVDERIVPFGIELSKGLAARAAQTFSVRRGHVVNAPTVAALPQFAQGSIDAVVMRSYLEHEPQPREVLAGSHSVLRDGGIVIIKVPNYASLNRRVMGEKWCGFRFPEHVNYFTPDSLSALARATGFVCEQGLLDRLPTNDNMWAVLHKA